MAEYSRPTEATSLDDVRQRCQPRTWRFWLIWTGCHLVLFVGALWYGWTHVAGGVFCAFGPGTAWYLKDEELKREKLQRLDLLQQAGVIVKDHARMYQTLQDIRQTTQVFRAGFRGDSI